MYSERPPTCLSGRRPPSISPDIHPQEPCTPKNQELRMRYPKNWPQELARTPCPLALPRISFPSELTQWRPTAHQEPKKELRTQERTRHTQEPRTKNDTPRTCPENSPAHLAPHTLTGARKGVLETVAAVCGENPTETCLVPRDGSGEPARAWSPAWDMVAADPCNGFQPG